MPIRGWAVPAFATAVVTALAIGLILEGAPNFRIGRSSEKIPQEILVDANQLEFFESMDMLESLRKLEALDGTKLQAVPGQQSQ
jgi:hypothetical protein